MRKLIPFSIELRLIDTIASLPRKLRDQLGNQGKSPRRGEKTAFVGSEQPELIDQLLKGHGDTWAGGKKHYLLIARLHNDYEIPAWVTVIKVHADSESPFAVFLAQLEENIGAARAREVGGSCHGPLYQDELDAKQKADEAAEAKRKQELVTRAADVIVKLRAIVKHDMITLLEVVKEREGNVRALEEIVDAVDGRNSCIREALAPMEQQP